jgi:hypothetical protein
MIFFLAFYTSWHKARVFFAIHPPTNTMRNNYSSVIGVWIFLNLKFKM